MALILIRVAGLFCVICSGKSDLLFCYQVLHFMLHTAYSRQASSLSPIEHLRMYASIPNALFFLFKDIVEVDCSKSRNLRDLSVSRRRSSRSRFFDTWGQSLDTDILVGFIYHQYGTQDPNSC